MSAPTGILCSDCSVPKNSRFKDLKLPSEFEYITTKKRLVKETAVQHHCVWSYTNSINKDRCAIYSTDTSEFATPMLDSIIVLAK